MIGNNNFVLINFVGRIKASGKVFDLTDKSIAEKEGIAQEGINFGPVLVIPDSNYVLKAVGQSLLNREIGDKYVLEVKAEDAFGKFDPKLVKTLGIGSFKESGVNPAVGDMLMLDNKLATVLSVSGGRVMVSFNNPLAGKDLVYEIEIVKLIQDVKDRCSAIFEHYAGKTPESAAVEENKITLRYKEELKQYTIDAIVSDINKYINKDFKVELVRS